MSIWNINEETIKNSFKIHRGIVEAYSWIITFAILSYLVFSTIFIKNDFDLYILLFAFATINLAVLTALVYPDSKDEKKTRLIIKK